MAAILPVMLAVLDELPWERVWHVSLLVCATTMVIPYLMVQVFRGWSELLHPKPPPRKRKATGKPKRRRTNARK
jgi:hypothetical protein